MGGVKVIYRLAKVCDELLSSTGSSAYICHPNHPNFRVSWFNESVKFRNAYFGLRWAGKPSLSQIRQGLFEPNNDVLVIPELWVRKYGSQLLELKIPYVILVQGGYLIDKGERSELSKAYAGAHAIWCVSDDSALCVSMAFPSVTDKIHRFHLHVDADKFRPSINKKPWVSYMPRKLGRHFELLKFFVGNQLPSPWEWKPIHGMSEDQVADLLSQSRIFVSLGELEGLGLPPIEAALAGNRVTGYTGQGGKEFWWPELFNEVQCGDILGLAQSVIDLSKNWSTLNQADAESARVRLAEKFSHSAMLRDLTNALRRIA